MILFSVNIAENVTRSQAMKDIKNSTDSETSAAGIVCTSRYSDAFTGRRSYRGIVDGVSISHRLVEADEVARDLRSCRNQRNLRIRIPLDIIVGAFPLSQPERERINAIGPATFYPCQVLINSGSLCCRVTIAP